MRTAANFLGVGQPILPPATAIPGQSAQNGVGICGPGTFSPTCGGNILYAGVPAAGRGGPGTSTWANESESAHDEQESQEQFFIDLGINAIDVLILAPFKDGQEAYAAIRRGDYTEAALLGGLTVCDVAKICQVLARPVKALARVTRVAPNSAATRGVSILGHYPEYVDTARRVRGRYFNVPMSEWNRLTAAEQWTANKKFLDRMIDRGDDVILATPATGARPGSAYSRELEYLHSRGYTLSADGTRMIPSVPR